MSGLKLTISPGDKIECSNGMTIECVTASHLQVCLQVNAPGVTMRRFHDPDSYQGKKEAIREMRRAERERRNAEEQRGNR